jgi:hypothetical protein
MIAKLKNNQIRFAFPLLPIYLFYSYFFSGIYQSDLNKFDWYIFNTETQVYRDAFSNLTVPGFLQYEMPNATALANIGEYYPAFPYGIRTPDVFLLPFIGNLSFMYIHIAWVAALGLYGIYKISKEIGASYFTYVLLSITWFLSGPLIARMGIGHTPLFGYFLIPLFFYLLLKLNSSRFSWTNILHMGLFLFLIGLLGSAIVFSQMCLILAINAILRIKYFYNYLGSIVVGLVLSSYLILPTLFNSKYINAPDRTVFEGYGWIFSNRLILKEFILNFSPTLENIANLLKLLTQHLIQIFQHLLLAINSQNAALKDAGWEWTLYSGIAYVLALTLILVFRRDLNFSLFNIKSHNSLMFKLCFVLAILSVSLVYRFIFKLSNLVFNFPAIDRIPYRMMIYVLFVSYLFLFKNLDSIVQKISNAKYSFIIKLLILISQLISLVNNASNWFLSNIYNTFQEYDPKVLSSKNVFSDVDNVSGITMDTYIGYGITIISFTLMASIYLIKLFRSGWGQNSRLRGAN